MNLVYLHECHPQWGIDSNLCFAYFTYHFSINIFQVLVNHCGVVFHLNTEREWSQEMNLSISLIENGTVKINS